MCSKVFLELLKRANRLLDCLSDFISIDIAELRGSPQILLRHHVFDACPQLVIWLEEALDILQMMELAFVSMEQTLFILDLLLKLLEVVHFRMEVMNSVHDVLIGR